MIFLSVNMDFKLIVILMAVLAAGVSKAQFYEDKRCRCICPSPASLLRNNKIERQVYIANVPPNKCNCAGVIIPFLGKDLKGHEMEFCPRCECKYEERNTTIIMVVVIITIWVLTILTGYMIFLYCLRPLLHKTPIRFHNAVGPIGDEGRMLLIEDDPED